MPIRAANGGQSAVGIAWDVAIGFDPSQNLPFLLMIWPT
jgi:hypothetical protein